MALDPWGNPYDPKPVVVEDEAREAVDLRSAENCRRGVEVLDAAIERMDRVLGYSLTVDARDLERENVRRQVEAIASGGEDVDEHGLTRMQLSICKDAGITPAEFASLAQRGR